MKLPVPMLSERGTTVGSKFTGNHHVPPSVKFTMMPNKDDCMFTRLYFKLDPSRYGDSATHQQVSNEQRCSPSSFFLTNTIRSDAAQSQLCAETDKQDTQRTTAMLAYTHKENMCLTAHTI